MCRFTNKRSRFLLHRTFNPYMEKTPIVKIRASAIHVLFSYFLFDGVHSMPPLVRNGITSQHTSNAPHLTIKAGREFGRLPAGHIVRQAVRWGQDQLVESLATGRPQKKNNQAHCWKNPREANKQTNKTKRIWCASFYVAFRLTALRCRLHLIARRNASRCINACVGSSKQPTRINKKRGADCQR